MEEEGGRLRSRQRASEERKQTTKKERTEFSFSLQLPPVLLVFWLISMKKTLNCSKMRRDKRQER